MTRVIRAGMAALAVLGALALTAPTASAADVTQYLDDGRGYGHVLGNKVEACDTKADDRGVFVEYRWPGGQGVVRDENGSSGGCGTTYAPSTVTSFHVCLRRPGSGDVDYCKPWWDV
ncbi:hypothetical protein [Saccharothrix obliqua]|uniref:hypothetical protein n=1 Tax=Saccharothrix obliqua TaxID=2861747 RepID=UPI001C5FAEC3|nr:hypothetical protein [Saccharothrix obliqua]MBW4721565.1 hypothetical protein [Saccharothrix obliqua]